MKNKQVIDVNDIIEYITSTTEGVAKKYQNPEGGLNAKGRAHFNKKGHNLKPPVSKKQSKKSPKAASRRTSFCKRMGGQKRMHNIDCRKNPDKDICKSLRKWDCNESFENMLDAALFEGRKFSEDSDFRNRILAIYDKYIQKGKAGEFALDEMVFEHPDAPECMIAVQHLFREKLLLNPQGLSEHEILVGGSYDQPDGHKIPITQTFSKNEIISVSDEDVWTLFTVVKEKNIYPYGVYSNDDDDWGCGNSFSPLFNIKDLSPNSVTFTLACWVPDFNYLDQLEANNQTKY